MPHKDPEKRKAYRKAHREKTKLQAAAYRKVNREKTKSQAAAWYKANREKVRANHAAWNKANPEKRRAYVAAWQKANPEKKREKDARRRAALQGCRHFGPIPPHVLAARAEVFGNRCAYCGGPHEHWDHVIPASKKSWHIPANLRPACESCNTSKGAKALKEWLNRDHRTASAA